MAGNVEHITQTNPCTLDTPPGTDPARRPRRALRDDGNRYEVAYGEGRLQSALDAYLAGRGIGVVFGPLGDISWGPDVLLSPDVFLVPLEQARTLDWSRMRDLLLVAEILSPASARHDRFTKRRRYQEAGVSLYWIVDPDERRVEVWTPADSFPAIEERRLAWRPEGSTEPFAMSLAELFRPL